MHIKIETCMFYVDPAIGSLHVEQSSTWSPIIPKLSYCSIYVKRTCSTFYAPPCVVVSLTLHGRHDVDCPLFRSYNSRLFRVFFFLDTVECESFSVNQLVLRRPSFDDRGWLQEVPDCDCVQSEWTEPCARERGVMTDFGPSPPSRLLRLLAGPPVLISDECTVAEQYGQPNCRTTGEVCDGRWS